MNSSCEGRDANFKTRIKVQTHEGPLVQHFPCGRWSQASAEEKMAALRFLLTGVFYLGRRLYRPFQKEGFAFFYKDLGNGVRRFHLAYRGKTMAWELDEKLD